MKDLKRHRLVYRILLQPIRLFMKLRFNYTYECIKHIEGPYIMVANHNLELDPLALGCAAHNHVYFVASEHILRKGFLSRLMMYFVKPIIHQKGRQGIRSVKEMLKTLQAGANVAIFPEGNRSFNGITMDMNPSIARVAQRSGAKLITYKIEGGYLTQPRWSTTIRRGELRGVCVNVYTPEQLKEMDESQIMAAIISDLSEDAYETQEKKPVAYKSKKLALGMESTLFMCPSCGKMGTLHSDDANLFCDCGFSAVYDVYGYLTDKEGKKYTVTELDIAGRKALEERFGAYTGDEPFFTDSITLYEIDDNHNTLGSETGNLSVYADRFECCGRVYRFEEMDGMAIYSRSAIIMNRKKEKGHIEIKGDIAFNALKYLYCYEIKEGAQA